MLNPLYDAIAKIVLAIHGALSPVFGANSGLAWGLSIVLLTMLMRLLLFPLFVKQIKTQRAMTTLQPQMKKIQQDFKGDRERIQVETMKLYREHGANPLMGCLPLLLQMPVFFALFHVLNGIRPNTDGTFSAHSGLSASQVSSAAHAKIFGAPIAAAFKYPADKLHLLSASPGSVKTVALIMVVLMSATTFWTQKQMMARSNATAGGNQFAAQQKVLLYILPFSFLFAGFNFPIGVLLYWLTTNIWSMVQQHVILSKLGPADAPPPPVKKKEPGWFERLAERNPAPVKTPPPVSAGSTLVTPETPVTDPGAGPRPTGGAVESPRRPGAPGKPPVVAAAARRPDGSRSRKNRARRGGRH